MEPVVYVVLRDNHIIDVYSSTKPARSLATTIAKERAMGEIGVSEFKKLDKSQQKHQIDLMKTKYSIEVRVFKDSGIKI